ncbi:MAG TPA: hypothetical protein VLA89_11825 [Gemmatimonadales bacterium]|nr:hypothetical protein [Gemmatimonadales bacterium]
MAKKDFPFTTHTGLVLDVEEDEDDGQWVVTLTGTTVKVVVRGDKDFCYEVAEQERKHYIERAKAEAT